MMDIYGDYMLSRPRVASTPDKDVPLNTDPHYSDDRFNNKVEWKAQTVFGPPSDDRGHPGLNYVYSDRLQQWDYAKSERARQAAMSSNAPKRSALFYEAYLSAYYGKPVELVHMMAGVNCSNGYPYWVAGYRDKETTTPKVK